MKGLFRLVGMSRPKSMTCEPIAKEETFHPNLDDLPQDRFDALWNLMEGNWGNGAVVVLEHDGLNNEIPINPKFIELYKIGK